VEPTRRARRNGFSVVEAIVALAIVAGGVMALAGLALRTTDIVARTRQRTVAAQLADAGLTELAARGVAASSPGCLLDDVAGCVEYRDASGQVVGGPAGAYALRWYARAVPSSPVPATLLTVCAVPEPERAPSPRPAGACATRVLREPWP
jgi:type II secretory pathway pseudopilin PulG